MNILKLAALLLASSMALAEVPQLINYQGMLTDAQNNPKLGTANLSFEFFDGVTSMNSLWGPQKFKDVPLIKGSFNIIIGTTDTGGRPLKEAVSIDESYLQITDLGNNFDSTDDDTLISPRQSILSAPYALKAAEADKATHHSNIVPAGNVSAFAGPISNIPNGWIICDGSALNALTNKEFEPLFNAIGKHYGGGNGGEKSFNLPDLRGIFIRGVDIGSGRDPGRGLGSYQDDDFESHTHNTSEYKHSGSDKGPHWEGAELIRNTATSSTGGTETRPKNLALHYIIKL